MPFPEANVVMQCSGPIPLVGYRAKLCNLTRLPLPTGFPHVASMKFSHLIEINDPLNPLIDPLTRAQLWRGLVLRAEKPRAFVPWLDRCNILDRSEASISRELHYGELIVHDRVTYVPQDQVRYHVPQQKDIPESTLTMTIEEPEPDILFVRFEYDDGTAEAAEMDAFYNEFRRSAYQESDIDTIRIIRQMAEEGRLGEANG